MASRQITLAAPFERLRRFANSHGYGNLDTLHASSRPGLTSIEDAEIISLYNAEIRGLLGYYQLARSRPATISTGSSTSGRPVS